MALGFLTPAFVVHEKGFCFLLTVLLMLHGNNRRHPNLWRNKKMRRKLGKPPKFLTRSWLFY